MTPEEEAYQEALRRIRKAEETGALELDLSGGTWEAGAGAWKNTGLETLTRLPPELEHLSGDLSPLASLTSLQSLNLS